MQTMAFKKIEFKVKKGNFYGVYTRLFMSLFGLTKSEACVLSEIMRKGKEVKTLDDKREIMKNLNISAREFAQYTYRLRRKNILKDRMRAIEVSDKVFAEAGNLEISIRFQITD